MRHIPKFHFIVLGRKENLIKLICELRQFQFIQDLARLLAAPNDV